VRQTFKGREFEGRKFQHPFLPLQVPGILADYVTLDQGSGIVHTAPGHGADDFYSGQKYGLETYAPLDDRGVYLEGLPEYKGKNVFEANHIIVKLLKDRGALLGHHEYKHTYPHCWRCHNPVIFRATEQWFINMDQVAGKNGKSLRQEALDELQAVKWIPGWGEERMYEMIEHRPDWCVSRQRFWGVPIIVSTATLAGRAWKTSPHCATLWSGSSGKAPTPGMSTPPRNCCRPAQYAPAARPNGAKKTTFWMCGLTPDHRTSQCCMAKSGLQTSTSKDRTNIAAGFRVRCWCHRHSQRCAVSRRGDPRLDAR